MIFDGEIVGRRKFSFFTEKVAATKKPKRLGNQFGFQVQNKETFNSQVRKSKQWAISMQLGYSAISKFDVFALL